MNRIKQAWRALCGTLEPEVFVREVEREIEKPVFGDLHRVRLYCARDNHYGYRIHPYPEWHGNLYLSCEQAHNECPGADVTVVDAVQVGGVYVETGRTLKVQPKPKVSKGRKRGS